MTFPFQNNVQDLENFITLLKIDKSIHGDHHKPRLTITITKDHVIMTIVSWTFKRDSLRIYWGLTAKKVYKSKEALTYLFLLSLLDIDSHIIKMD